MSSVRAKFALIVALCVLPLALATWFISRALQQEEREDALGRVGAAEGAFEAALKEDIARLQIAVRMITSDPDVAEALSPLDRTALQEPLQHFGKVWPGLRVLIVDPSGAVLVSSHAEEAGGLVGAMPEVKAALAGKGFEGITKVAQGAAAADHLGHAYAVVQPIEGQLGTLGAVLAAFPLDDAYLETAQRRHRLGLSLALEGKVVARSSEAPPGLAALAPGAVQMFRGEDRSAALAAFEPALLRRGGQSAVVTASLDLTEQERDHHRFLLYRLLSVAGVAAVALLVAGLIARKMNASVVELQRVLPGVALQKYEPVRVVQTGDELQHLLETWNGMVAELKEGALWKRALGKYLSRAALEAVKKGDLALGGTAMPATVLFSDIRGFTTLAERMPPEKLLRILNRYFTEMVSAVMHNEGIVDKFIGDAIMAVWGPPTPSGRDAELALRAALDMRRRLEVLNKEFAAQGLPTLRTGIGIHSGAVVAGNIGAEGDDSMAGKMEYTVIGDTVNLASRLESMTKELKVDILVSGDTALLAGDQFQLERLAEAPIRGREQPVQLYRLDGIRAPSSLADSR